MRRLLPKFLAILLLLAPLHVRAETLTIWAEIYEPLSYSKGGRLVGFSSMVVNEMVRRAGVEVKKRVLAPWAYVFNIAPKTPNSLLYTVVRKPDREDMFHWIGPISDRRILLYKMKRDASVAVESLADAGKYPVGALRDAAANDPLIEAGVTLDESPSPSIQFAKLISGRNRLSIFLDFSLSHLALKNGYAPTDFEPVLMLDDSKKYYVALSLETSPQLVDRLNSAFQSMKADGELLRIRNQHLK